MDYNRQTIANEIASFKYTMKQTNDDISPAEIIDGLMQWVEQYTNVLHEISVAETLDDLKELKQNAACPDLAAIPVLKNSRSIDPQPVFIGCANNLSCSIL